MPSSRARVARIQSAGPVVRLELSSETSEAIHVELSHERFRQEPLTLGAQVFVTPRDSRVFVEDYTDYSI